MAHLHRHSPFRQHKTRDKHEIDRMTMTMSVEMPDSFSIELRSLLTGLLQRDVHKRLGCRGRGAEEIKSHPFFRGIDWRVVFLLRLAPPLIPARGEVNAADAFDIGSFDDEDTKHIKLTDADQELYRNFPVVVSERWQHEIAETIFDYINHEADKAEMKRKNKHKLGYQEEEQSDCILHGYIKRLGGTFTATWLTRYVRLYPNRLELWSDSGKQPELIFMDQIEEVCNDYVQIKNEQCIVIKLYNHSKYVFTNSDEIGLKEWHVSLKAAHKESMDMMTTMAEKATKIYGTEIPVKHMGKRRQQLQQEANNNTSSAISNLEQKIIQKELRQASSSSSLLAAGPTITAPAATAAAHHPQQQQQASDSSSCSSGKASGHQPSGRMPMVSSQNASTMDIATSGQSDGSRTNLVNKQQQLPPPPPPPSSNTTRSPASSAMMPVGAGSSPASAGPADQSGAPIAAPSAESGAVGAHKHHRGHHQHRIHHHRHRHHHDHSLAAASSGGGGVAASGAGSAGRPHHHHHHHHHGHHGGIKQQQQQHKPQKQTTASEPAAAAAMIPEAAARPAPPLGLNSTRQPSDGSDQRVAANEQQEPLRPMITNDREAHTTGPAVAEPEVDFGQQQQQQVQEAAAQLAGPAEQLPAAAEGQAEADSSNMEADASVAGTRAAAGAARNSSTSIQSVTSSISSGGGGGGADPANDDNTGRTPPDGASSSDSCSSSGSSGSNSEASDEQLQPVRVAQPAQAMAAAATACHKAPVGSAGIAETSAQTNRFGSVGRPEVGPVSSISTLKPDSEKQQQAPGEPARIKLAVSLENVSEQQEVLRDPSKRITSDNKQREQDLVAQYEKLNVTSRTSSLSIEEENV